MKQKTVRANEYTITTKGNYVKVFINGILHLSVLYNKVLGMQTWINSTGWYCIEIYTENKDIMCECDSVEKWSSVIKLLNNTIK